MSSGKIGRSMRYKDLLPGIIHCKKGVMSSYNEIFKFSGSEKGKFRLKVIEHFESFRLLSCNLLMEYPNRLFIGNSRLIRIVVKS